jgi:Bacterial Ig-like domain/F5/8 type C domain
VLAALLAASPLRAGEVAHADLSILGLSVEVDRKQVVTAIDIAAAVQTIFGGHMNGEVPPSPQLTLLGDLTGPGIDVPIVLSTQPGQKFAIPPLHAKGEYTLQNIRLVTAAGQFVQQAVPAFATIVVADVMTTAVTVHQLTPDELRARGITVDPRNYDGYSYSIALTVGTETVVIPYFVLVDRTTHEVITPPAADGYALPQLTSNAIPPRFEPPSTLPMVLSDSPEDVPFTPGASAPGESPSPRRPTIPATVVIPSGFGVLHEFFAVVLHVSNAAPPASEVRIDSITASLDAPLALRVAKTAPPVSIGQPLPIVDQSTGTTFLVAGGQGTGEWSLEALKPGTHTIDLDVRATYKAPNQRDTPMRGKASASLVVTDPRFHITFSHPDATRRDEPYTAFAFVTNLSPQSQSVRLDTSAIAACGQGYTSEICRDETTSGITELTIAPGAMVTVPYKLKSRIDGHFYAAAGAASDAAVGVDVKLTMGVSASGIPLSPATLLMPWYARYLDSAFVDANLSLLGLGYSLATAPLNATTAKLPRVLRSDVFHRAQEIARAGQRIFIARHDPAVSDPAGNRDAIFNLSLDLLDNVERIDRLAATPELREWDQLRRSELNGRRAAAAMTRQLEANGLAGGRTMTQLVADFAAATAHRAPYFVALVHAPPVGGAARSFALSAKGSTSGGRLDIPAESIGTACSAPPCSAEGVRTLPYAELTRISSGSEAGELAMVGRWKEDLQLSIVPQADRFTVDLIYPDTVDGTFLTSSFEVTGATTGSAVTFAVARGSRTIVESGASAVPLVNTVAAQPLRVVAAAQDLYLDQAGHVVSMLFNRPVSVADAAALRDAFSLTTTVTAASWTVTRRNAGGQIFIPGASLQDDATIVTVNFDKALSTNATYLLAADGITDPTTHAAASLSGIVPRIDNNRPGGILAGRVLRGDNTAIAAAPVQLLSGDRYQFETSTADGRYLFEFVARDIDRGESGNYVLSATADGKYTEAQGAIRLPGQVQTVNLTFLGRGSAGGVIRYSDGVPVAKASIAISSPIFGQFRTTTTDTAGRYSVGDLPVGPLTFAATDGAGRTTYATNQVRTPGELVTQDLVIQKSEVAGTASVRVTVRRSDVSDPAKALVPNARVGIYSRGYGITEGTTDANGRCEFTGVPAGFVSVLAAEFNLTRESAAVDLEVRADAVVDQVIVLHVPTPAEQSALVTIQGTITRDDPAAPNDSTRDRAVAAAVLTIPGLAAVTADTEGNYIDSGIPPAFGATKSMNVFDPDTGRRGTFLLPTLVAGTNQFSVRLRSSVPAGAAKMRVRLFGARDEPVSGVRVLSPYFPPLEFSETAAGVYELAKVNVPQQYDVWAVPRDRSGTYGDQYARGSVRVDFDGQIGFADLHLPGQGTIVAKLEVSQPCANPPCYAAATGPVTVSYLTWNESEQVAVATEHRVDPDPVTGNSTMTRVPAGQDVSVTTIDNPAGFAAAVAHLAFDGDSRTVTLRLDSLAQVSGRVLMFDGQTPAAGASVRLEGSIANVLPVTTGADGSFTFAAVAANQAFRVVAETTQDGVFRTSYAEARTPAGGGIVGNLTIVLREQSSVEGRVLDANDVPVPLAKYWLRELSWPYRTFGSPADPLIAGQSGGFVVSNVFSGAFRITAVSPEVQELRGDYQGEIRFEGDTSQRDVSVHIGGAGTASVSVAVVNPENAFERVANAEVTLLRNDKAFDFTTTDANGLAVFDQVPAAGTYALHGFSKALGRAGSAADFTVTASIVANVTLTLEFRGMVSGVVRDPESTPAEAPVKGAPVTLREPAMATRASTDASGAFEFSGIPEGKFSLEAFDVDSGRRGSGPAGLFISKLYPERRGIQIELERTASLHVKVFLPDDSGKAGLLAALTDVIVKQGDGVAYLRELQGNDLTFARLFARQPYSIEAKELGGEGRVVKASGGFASGSYDATETLVFPTSGRVEVTVRDAASAPVVDARVTIDGGRRSATLYTGASGVVALDGFALGPIVVQAQKGNVAAAASGTLNSHSTPLALTLNLGASASIAGWVDAETGGPSAGTRVIATVTSRLLVSLLQLETITDTSGAYRFDAIPIGGTNVTVTCLGPDDVTAGATVTRSIVDGTSGIVDLGRVRLDATPPRVLNIDPPSNANNVSPNSVVVVTLSEPIAPQFVAASAFQLISTDDGQPVRSALVGSQPGAGGTFVVTITAPDPTPEQIAAGQKYRLKSNVVYRVVIASGIQDLTGNSMRTTVGATFTTSNYTEPVITSIAPPVDAPLPQQATFRIRFNKAIDETSFAPGGGGVLRLEQLGAYKGAPTASIDVSYYRDAVDASTLVVAPRTAIAASSYYRLTIGGTRDTQVPPNVQPSTRTFDYFSFDTVKPVVTIDSPVPAGYPLISGVAYTATPTITDEGTQTRSTDTAYVDWFDGTGAFVSRSKVAPFGYTFVAPAATGTPTQFVLKAAATDLSGNASAMASRSWDVAPNDAPKDLRLTADATSAYPGKLVHAQLAFADEGLVVTVSLKLSGTARDGSLYVSELGSTKVSRGTVADAWPVASFSFTVPNALKEGSATLTATATDSVSKSASAATTLEVLADSVQPSIVSLLPKAETHFANGQTLMVEVQARDAESGIARTTIAIGSNAPVPITAGAAGSTLDAATGIWTFRTSITVPRRNADTRTRIAVTVLDNRDNAASATTDVVYDRVDDPAVPTAAWLTPLDGAALPIGQSGWLTTLRITATGNVAQVSFTSSAMASPVVLTSPKGGTADVYEARVPLNMPADGSTFVITATISDGIEAHLVELPIAVDPVPIDTAVVSNELAITSSNAADYANKSLLLRGPNTRLFVYVPVTLKNLIALDGALISNPTQTKLSVTIADRFFADGDSSIDVAARGYLGGWALRDDHTSRNESQRGQTAGATTDGGALASASHGGNGGASPDLPTNVTYGSLAEPSDFGSGGGGAAACCIAGGSGGGAVALFGGTAAGDLARFVVAGSIRADGESGIGAAFAGSGGSIQLRSRALITGAASRITANGGDDDTAVDESRGGGGGRIAVTALDRFDCADIRTVLQARGGRNGTTEEASAYTDGGAGSLLLRRGGVGVGELIVSSFDTRYPASTHVTSGTPLAGALTFDAITVGPRALARFDAPYTVADPAMVKVDPTALLLRPVDVPAVSVTSTSSAGTTLIQDSVLVTTFDAAAVDGIDHVRGILSAAPDAVRTFGDHPPSVVANQLTSVIPATAAPGPATLKLRAVSRSGRSVETAALPFTVVANTPPSITQFDLTPSSELYAGHAIAVSATASDDVEVKSLALTASAGTVTSTPAVPNPAAHSLSQQFSVAIPPATASGTGVQLTISAADNFPGRAPATQTRTVIILKDQNPPSIAVSKPSAGQIFDEGSGNSIAVEATVVDVEVAVKRAYATLDGRVYELAPAAGRANVYTADVPVPNVDGIDLVSKTVTVTAADYDANEKTTDALTIRIRPLNDPNAPALAWTCGSPVAVYPPGGVAKLRVYAKGNTTANGVVSVEFQIGDPATIVTASPVSGVSDNYEATYTLPAAADGTAVPIRAVARSVGGNTSDLSTSIVLYAGTLFTANASIAASDPQYDHKAVFVKGSGVTLTIAGHHEFTAVGVLDGAIVNHPATAPTAVQKLDIVASAVFVSCDSKIDATGRGFAGSVGGIGYTYKDATSGTTVGGSSNGCGGSHGGRGGFDSIDSAAAVFGSPFDPNEPGGSGSAGNCAACVAGGGVVRIAATTIAVDGSIVANGLPLYINGQGAGGSIRLDAASIGGSGQIHADGGDSYESGGGGRVALYFQSLKLSKTSITARGGKSGWESGATAGTIYLREVDASGNKISDELIVDNPNSPAASRTTPFAQLGGGTVTAASGSVLTLSAAVPDWIDGCWIELLDGAGSVAATYRIASHTATTVSLEVPAGTTLTAPAGTPYRGIWRFDAVTLRNYATVSFDSLRAPAITTAPTGFVSASLLRNESIAFTGWAKVRGSVDAPQMTLDAGVLEVDGLVKAQTLKIRNGSKLQQLATVMPAWGRLSVQADTISLDATSSIDATARGFVGTVGLYGYTYKDATSGTTIGGSYNGAGGSHGGRGGAADGDSAATYGSMFDPGEPGGGGSVATNCTTCSAGGGVIRISANAFTLDGGITANGVSVRLGGQGAGGSIRIDVPTITGNGQIHADGGSAYTTGGGGRIAIYYQTSTISRSNITAAGGSAGSALSRGAAGTIYLKRPDQPNGELIVDNASWPVARATTLTAIGAGTITAVEADRMTASAAAFEAPNILAGLRLFVNGDRTKTWLVKANEAKSLTVDVSAAPFTTAAGQSYRGMARFDSVRLRYSVLTSRDVIDALSIDKDGASTLTYDESAPSFAAALKSQIVVSSVVAGDFVVGPAGAVSDPDTPVKLTATNQRTSIAYTANAAADGSFSIRVDGQPGDGFTLTATDSHVSPMTSEVIAVGGVITEANVVTAVTLTPSTVSGGNSSVATVRLQAAARLGGCTVAVTSSDSSAVVPQSVVVPQGTTFAQFAIATTVSSSPAAATIRASLPTGSQSALLQIVSPSGGIASLAVSPASVAGGTTATATVTLAAAAPAGGAVVAMTSSNPLVAPVPATVTVPAAETSASFAIPTAPAGAETAVTISAFYGNAQSASLTLTPCATMAAPPVVTPPAGDTVWVEDAMPAGATAGSIGAAFSTAFAVSGTQSLEFAAATGPRQWSFSNAAALTVGSNDRLIAYALIDPCNPPREIVVAWSDGTSEYRATWGDDVIEATIPHKRIGTMPAGGAWTRLEVLAAAIGASGRSMRGLSIKLFDGQAWFDHVGVAACSVARAPAPSSMPNDRVWVDDTLPAGASSYESWQWDASQAASGTRSHHLSDATGSHSYHFDNATDMLKLGSGDVIVTYVLLSPCRPVREVMLSFIDEAGSAEHRAYWGENIFTNGSDGTGSRMHVGPLPEGGVWTRLEVPAVLLGLEGHSIRGAYFALYDGEAWFDRLGSFTRINAAMGKSATQSSSYSGQTPASRAVDGDVSGNGETLTAMTASQPAPWWSVDLGSVQPVEHVVLWNRSDCCASRLAKFWLFASAEPFVSAEIAATRAQAGVASFYCDATVGSNYTFRVNRNARFFRVQLTGTDTLQLAELQAFAPSVGQPMNLAGGGAATQSSTSGSAAAERAVDGNIDGKAATSTDTGSAATPWWQLDVGSIQPISFVDVWNRSDSCCSTNLTNFHLFVSDSPFSSMDPAQTAAQPGVTPIFTTAAAVKVFRFPLNRTGRYLRIQLSATTNLTLGEVQVWSQQPLVAPLSVKDPK